MRFLENQMKNKKILVTGGAGYIGSHVVRQLGAAGESIITLDNLSTGFEAAVTAGELIVGDTGDAALLQRIFSEHDIDTVMHFAAHTIVPESVADPLKYYGNNTASSRTLLEAAARHGVRNIVFSSTAAVYGIREEHRILLHGGRVRDPGRWQSIRGLADSTYQPIRHIQTHDRMDVARPGGGRRPSLCRPALLQRRRL
jgi:nucleoside-diphosphate-sugar epimerase